MEGTSRTSGWLGCGLVINVGSSSSQRKVRSHKAKHGKWTVVNQTAAVGAVHCSKQRLAVVPRCNTLFMISLWLPWRQWFLSIYIYMAYKYIYFIHEHKKCVGMNFSYSRATVLNTASQRSHQCSNWEDVITTDILRLSIKKTTGVQ